MKKIFLLSLISLITSTFSYAQNVAINTDASLPNNSAMLDVKSTNKGMLIPRVALTGTADVSTVPSPATSLMVYNTTAAGSGDTAVVAGYYYWNGTAWVRMVSSTTATNTAYKTLIPFASGSAIPITTTSNTQTGNPSQVAIIGFGNGGTILQNNGSIDLTPGPNYAFVLPSSGIITDISGTITLASNLNAIPPMFIYFQLYFAPAGSNTFTLLSGTSVSRYYFGSYSTGFTTTGSLSGLNIAVAAGTRILMVVSASFSFGPNLTTPVYFSGGVNMVIQ